MLAFLRTIRAIARRVWLAVFGADEVQLKRLMRSGRVRYGVGTYGLPTIRTYDYDETRLIVGNYCSIAAGSTFLLGGNHPTDRVTTYPHRIWMGMEGAGSDGFPAHTQDTVLGNDVWICAGAMIVSGVTIGDGAIVTAGAVVTHDVPPFAMVGGSPARVIRYRFSEEERAQIQATRWWDWPEDEVRRAVPLLAERSPQAFLEYARERMGESNVEVGFVRLPYQERKLAG